MGLRAGLAILLLLCLLGSLPLAAQQSDGWDALNARLVELYQAGEYRQAAAVAREALALAEDIFGPEHASTATSQNNLALVYASLGDYEQARSLYERALAINEKALGPEHPDTATSLHNLAGLYYSMGDYGPAPALFERALAIREKSLGPEHADTAQSLNNLAVVYKSMGNYLQARRLHERALAIREKALGPAHPDTAISLDNLAVLCKSLGDYEQALPLCERALVIREKALGSEHPVTAISLNNLAGLYESVGDYERARPLYERALAIWEKALGPEHPRTATGLNNLAYVYESMNDYERARPLYERALAVQEKELDPEDPRLAGSLNNLANLHKSMGDYEQARRLHERALAIRQKRLGPDHPDTAQSLRHLASLDILAGRPSEALALARRAASADRVATENVFRFASERQRLAYREGLHPFNLFATLGSPPDLLQAALRYKGLVLDSIVEDQRLAEASDDPATRATTLQLKTVKSLLNQLTIEIPTDFSEAARSGRKARERQLRQQVEALETTLARSVTGLGRPRRAFSITADQVRPALPGHAVLVEFLRYYHYLGKDGWEARYGAVLLPRKGDPLWAPLPGKAEEIEKLIATYQRLVRGQPVTADELRAVLLGPKSQDSTVPASEILSSLYGRVWAPVEKVLPEGTQTVVVSPDGQLNFVSFATLVTPENRFLCEDYKLVYVSSGRDLVSEVETSQDVQTFLVGEPDFGLKVPSGDLDGTGLSRAVEASDWRQLSFAGLPYTGQECLALERFFVQRGQPAQRWVAEQATEARVRSVKAPRVLHLATHGFFLPEPEARRKGRQPESGLKDPMYRSGLALAGAQTTVDARLAGNSPETKNDGLLTAAEVGVLSLHGTWLVTLSACDTGFGESRAGEGVLGLRRGFAQAGTRNLLMTLWPVADKETSELMQDFYLRAETLPAPLALHEVQTEWLVRLRDEEKRPLAEVVRLAGPFVLTLQGRLEE